MGGFDTHSDQLTQQDSLFNDLNQSMNAFYQATTEMGVANNVTTFTLVGFRPHLPAEQRRHRSRVGQPPPDHGRRREGRRLLRDVPDAGRERSGRRHRRRAAGFRRPRSTNTPRRWRHGSAWRRQTCHRSSRTWRTSRRRRWGSWVKAAHPPTKETTPSRARSLYFLRLECGLFYAPFRAPAAKDTTPASTRTPATSGGKRSLCSVCTPIFASPIFTP